MLVHCCDESAKRIFSTFGRSSYQISLWNWISLCNGSLKASWMSQLKLTYHEHSDTERMFLCWQRQSFFTSLFDSFGSFHLPMFRLQNFMDHWNFLNERRERIIMRRRWLWLCKFLVFFYCWFLIIVEKLSWMSFQGDRKSKNEDWRVQTNKNRNMTNWDSAWNLRKILSISSQFW